MEQAIQLLRKAPPTLVFLVCFAGTVAFGLLKLFAWMQAVRGV